MLSGLLKAVTIGGLGILGSSKIIESKMRQYDTEIFRPIDTISIILSVLNEEQYIETAISSIFNQSMIKVYPDYFELIVADSCSTDGSIELTEKILETSPIKSLILITPRGKLNARNIATNEARGNLIVSIDADTYYPPMWLNTILEPFNNISNPKYENVVAVSGSTDYTAGLQEQFPLSGPLFSLGDFLFNKLINTHRMVGRNCVVFKHIHQLVGGFDEKGTNQSNIWSIFAEEECNYGNRISRFGKVIYKLNAGCVHLGGSKTMNRIIKSKEYKKDRDTF